MNNLNRYCPNCNRIMMKWHEIEEEELIKLDRDKWPPKEDPSKVSYHCATCEPEFRLGIGNEFQ